MTKVILEQKEYERLLGDFIKKELYKKRIDKAIEYIKTHREAVDERNGKTIYWLTDDFDEEVLLEILRGEEDDKTK